MKSLILFSLVLLSTLAFGQTAARLEKLTELNVAVRAMDGNTTRAKVLKSSFVQIGGRDLPGFQNVYVMDAGSGLAMTVDLNVLRQLDSNQVQQMVDVFEGLYHALTKYIEADLIVFLSEPYEAIPRAILAKQGSYVLFK